LNETIACDSTRFTRLMSYSLKIKTVASGCVFDYRQLNKLTSYALSVFEELPDCYAGNKFFSVVDMKSG